MLESIVSAGNRRAVRSRLKVQPDGFNGHFGVALFDLKRQNVLTTDPEQRAAADPDRRGDLARPRTRSRRQSRAGVQDGRRFTTYDLFISKDLNPALIGKVPTNTPQRWRRLGRLHLPGRAADAALALAAASAMSARPLPNRQYAGGSRRSCSATRRSTTNGRTGARRSTSSTSPTRSMSQAARRPRPASTAIGAASRRASPTNGSAPARGRQR